MKEKTRLIIITLLLGLLSGCLNDIDSQNNSEKKLSPDTVSIQTTANQLSPDNYRSVITDGRYELGATASSDSSLSSPGNTFAFEEGLMRLAREVFPTDQYFLQEGQLMDINMLTSWTSRESEENPEGLNPAIPSSQPQPSEEQTSSNESSQIDPEETETTIDENGQTFEMDEEGNLIEQENPVQDKKNQPEVQSTPIYLSQIMEKNIMVETDDGFELAGIVIGLSMNSSYKYSDPEGVVYEQEISMGEMRERGRAYANIIVGRLRATEQLRSIPIVVGIYRQADEDEIVGGTYISDGISREGNAVSDWTDRNEYRIALPLLQSGVEAEKYAYFDNFSEAVRNFFPNLNGVSGQALYINDNLNTLDIEIVTQFYEITEITALTQHVTDMAQRYLPEHIDIEIKISSDVGLESFLARRAGQTAFQSYIFRQ